ncbi:hypothetical protein CL616_02105 [archaeon]|nr:hypothetical protein [archaeon]|tara:strand:- start:843 stop:1220 length:378 start_codon:yes stop_codon:yes gene_type:complete
MLTLQFVPYNDIEKLSSNQRISKLMNLVKKNKIVMLQGRLKSSEEALLIEKTMQEVSKDFKGIELCTVFPKKNNNFFKKFVLKMFVGDIEGFTVIGPANIVKDIKRNPDKVELLLARTRRKNGRK